MKKFKEKQTVYYCLACYNKHDIKEYHVFAYEWHNKYERCFDMELAFDNRKDAEEKAKQLNGE